MPRLTRSESKALTRQRLLKAAREVFIRQGFHATTVDQIAEEAGYSKGAVYSQFDSKVDVFLALYEERVNARVAKYLQDAENVDSQDQARAATEEWLGVLRKERDWSSVLIEFWAYTARDPAVRERFSALRDRTRDAFAQAFEVAAKQSGRELALSPQVTAMTFMSLANGFALESFANPDLADTDIYETVFYAVFNGLSRGERNDL